GPGGLAVRSRLWGQRAPGPKPDSTEGPLCMRPSARYIIRSGQTSPNWCGAEAWRGGASSGVSPSFDCGSKLRGSSQNSPRVVSKRDVYITKPTTPLINIAKVMVDNVCLL
ncbi:hypothetical protein AVEN_165652-1, partial [Araneus ventricosus]